jgi:hypothetical protein
MAVAQVYLVKLMVGCSGDDTVTSDKIIFASYGSASLRSVLTIVFENAEIVNLAVVQTV